MKTSIIIPYHKGDSYLRDCLESLKEQIDQDMEILLIIDHAEEKELVILGDYETELPIKVYRLDGKIGVAAARNLGISKATGDYIYFLDSDDYLYGNTIEKLILSAQEKDDDIIYGKKKSTWFGRSVFLVREQDQESDNSEEENDASDIDPEELNTSNSDTSHDDNTDGDPTEEDGSSEEKERLSREARSELKRLEAEERKHQAYRILITKRKGIRNISVLNILFKRSFLEKNKVYFSENLKYMSDAPFLLEALSKTDKLYWCPDAYYVKRNHNDPINLPSLTQVKDPDRFHEYIVAYNDTIGRIQGDSLLRDVYDRKYIAYYTKTYAPKLKRSISDIWREENFLQISDIISKASPEVIKSLKGYKKRLIYALINRDINKSIKIVKFHLGVRKFKSIIKNKRALAKFLYIHSFIKKPMRDNWVIFESFFGKSYSDNPKYVYEYLAKNFPGQYKFIWVIDKKGTKIPYKHTKVKRFGIRYAYYLARCKYYVMNVRQPAWVRKREDNIMLETWHGTPLKKLAFDVEDITSASPKHKQIMYQKSRDWDYLIAANQFSSDIFRRCFLFDKTMLETGYPRNDILHYENRDEIAQRIKEKLKIPKDKKTILYAPTWRDDEYYESGKYKFSLMLDLKLLKEKLGKDYVILLRTHYYIADSLDITGVEDFAINLSKYDDISEIYLVSDILITDYSSVFFDYANLKRPMLFFTYDLEKYRDVLRGFYFDFENEVPGPLLYSTEEIIDAIGNIEHLSSEYSQRYDKFYQRFCEWEDGHASEKVVKSVFKR